MWKKIIEQQDLIVFEKHNKENKGLFVRIEARKGEDGSKWGIFKSYHDHDKFNFVEEYFANSREEVLTILESLKVEKELTKEQILEVKKTQNKKVAIEVKRVYKEIDVEKWNLSINKGEFNNFFIIFYGPNVDIDIILDERYMMYEDSILAEISNILSLDKISDEINQNVYYYNKLNKKSVKGKEKIMVGKIEMGLDLGEDN